MCAIAGLIDLPYCSEIENKLLNTMKRRGPDAQGIFETEDCCLLHTRLIVIDPDGGKQPMTLHWGRESYTIVYNGELYNTSEVREKLRKEGHRFLGHSDTEVVLHAFAQWEEDCLAQLNGIFSFAVWNNQDRSLFLARDRMGVKPLYYTMHAAGLLFASEIKTLLAYPSVEARLDAQGIAQLLLLGPGRIPGSGVFKDIMELEPGFCGWYREGKLCSRPYWSLKDREHTENFEDTAAYVRYLVTDSIERQMISDVPIGTFLSGGLDSSLISSVCAVAYAKDGMRLPTFSVDYQDNDINFVPGKFQPDSDNAYIRIMTDSIGSSHHKTLLSTKALLCSLEDATRARDLPGMADVDFSLLLFCREIRNEVKVALSGECADEIFGGYPWFRDPEIRTMEGFPWAQNTKQRAAFLMPEVAAQIDPVDFVMDQYRHTVEQSDILPGTNRLERRMKEMVNLNMKWFMQTLLDRKDRMSMYNGLEVRVPFCDHRIAEYLYGVPWSFKDYKGREKGLLRFAMRDLLPEAIVNRKKSPYPKTYDPQYLNAVTIMLRDVISEDTAPILQLVRKEVLTQLLDTEFLWPWYGQLMRLPQTLAYMLQINFWLKEYHVKIV